MVALATRMRTTSYPTRSGSVRKRATDHNNDAGRHYPEVPAIRPIHGCPVSRRLRHTTSDSRLAEN